VRIRPQGLVSAVVLVLASAPGWAAWTLPEGDAQLIVRADRYSTDEYFDEQRSVRSLPANGDYSKDSVSLYTEYGLRDTWMLFANLPVEHATYEDDSPYRASGTSLGDFEFGVRHRLSAADVPYAWSWQVSFKTPLYGSSQQPEPGNHQLDIDLRMPLGYGWGTPAGGGYIVAYPGVRLRAGAPTNEARLDVALGLRPSTRWLFEASVFELHSLQHGEGPALLETNPEQGIDFDRTRLQLQGVYWSTAHTGLLLGAYRDVAGRNIGRGTGFYGGVWLKI
jgi:hypothetical protein